MNRRQFLLYGASTATLASCTKFNWLETTPHVTYPGMQEGHLLRDQKSLPASSGEITTEVVILGSGIAALTTAWKLCKEGFHNFLIVSGPEFGGNASGGAFGNLHYPKGAHYLPIPSLESTHIREMLYDFGLIQKDPFALKPYYDESAIIHGLGERLFFNSQWQDGLLPSHGVNKNETDQYTNFFQYISQLKNIRGVDNKKLFTIPFALSSTDPQWTKLDQISFKQWLINNNYTAPTLHWYLNYCCRDDYGATYEKVSAWAGLHYFASRTGQAQNAEEGTELTWPGGLSEMVKKIVAYLNMHMPKGYVWNQSGFAINVKENSSNIEVLCANGNIDKLKTFTIKAKRVVCAMPLYVASHVFPGIKGYGFHSAIHTPSYAPWLVSNFLMSRFPNEKKGTELAWDNVVYEGEGLGYVVSTHQDIRVARPPQTVFTAYDALSDLAPTETRKWLFKSNPKELFEKAAVDLKDVYGLELWRSTKAIEITVRGHAMASPTTGFLNNKGLDSLRKSDGKVLFAHSDLSGFSVFEEAAWWGYQAANKIINS